LTSNITTICTYFHNLYGGGLQRVMALQAKLWIAMGYRVIVLTDQSPTSHDYTLLGDVKRVVFPSASMQVRAQFLEDFITSAKIDVFICNDWNYADYATDLTCVKKTGAFFVNILHHNFSGWAYFFQDTYDFQNQELFPLLDALVTLAPTQQLWWSCLGAPAYYIPNPLTYSPDTTPKSNPSDRNIIWMGRTNDSGKKLTDAILVFSKVSDQFPDARLIVIGPLPPKPFDKTVRRFITQLNLDTKVNLVGFKKDISEYLKNAWVHLSTSIVESFSMVIAEACAFNVPTVMYELPYLAITQTNKGFLSVPQGDITGLADALTKVLNDRTLRDRLGDDAKTNLAQFEDRIIIQGWKNLFTRLETGKILATEINFSQDRFRDFRAIVQEVNRSQNYLFDEQRWKIKTVNYIERFFPTDKYGNSKLKPFLQWVYVTLYKRSVRLAKFIRR
jgi:glycosyltransferase involved in cell wall biosynthesis